jgi:hypothetical protein
MSGPANQPDWPEVERVLAAALELPAEVAGRLPRATARGDPH